jgi:hypothetical protein
VQPMLLFEISGDIRMIRRAAILANFFPQNVELLAIALQVEAHETGDHAHHTFR